MSRSSDQKPNLLIDCEITRETEKAYLLKIKNPAPFGAEYLEFWFPKSQVEVYTNEQPYKASIPEWLASAKGLAEGSWK